jgi:transposase InsO family protein
MICHPPQVLHALHRLAPPRHPQTNGMVERFNGRITELVKQTRFDSRADLEKTLLSYLKLYNHHIPQRASSVLPHAAKSTSHVGRVKSNGAFSSLNRASLHFNTTNSREGYSFFERCVRM